MENDWLTMKCCVTKKKKNCGNSYNSQRQNFLKNELLSNELFLAFGVVMLSGKTITWPRTQSL